MIQKYIDKVNRCIESMQMCIEGLEASMDMNMKFRTKHIVEKCSETDKFDKMKLEDMKLEKEQLAPKLDQTQFTRIKINDVPS